MAKVRRKNIIQFFSKGNKSAEGQFEDLTDSNLNLLDWEITTDVDHNVRFDINDPKKLHVNGILQLKENKLYLR